MIREREHVFLDSAAIAPAVVEQEVVGLREQRPVVQQRSDLAVVPLDESVARPLVVAGPVVLHPVLFGKALDLPMAEHRKPRQGRHQGRDAEKLVAGAELVDRRALVRVRHEVDVALHDAGVELQRVLEHLAVVRVVLVAQHDHESRVIDPVHAQRADEVALHQPERLGQQQRAGDLARHAVDDLAPELLRDRRVEGGGGHGGLRAGGDRAARARRGEPQPLDVPLRQRHRRVEPDDRKLPRDLEDGLDDLLAHRAAQVVELRRVVPGEAGAVVAVVDVLPVAGPLVAAQKDHGRVGLLVVVVLDLDLDAIVPRQVRAVEGVSRVGRVVAGEEPLRMVDDPGRVDAHVVGHHVARQANAVPRATVAQVAVGGLAAERFRYLVVVERIGAGHRVGIAAQVLNRLGRTRALPHADEPERVHAAAGEGSQFLVGNLVQRVDVAAVEARKLVEPHEGALRDHDRARHPLLVWGEGLVLLHARRVVGYARGRFGPAAEPALARRVELPPQRQLLFLEKVAAEREAAQELPDREPPARAQAAELVGERTAALLHGEQKGQQAAAALAQVGQAREELRESGRDPRVGSGLREPGVVEQLAERRKGRVAVAQPQQQHLLERGLTVREALGLAPKPLLGGDLAGIDVRARKVLNEREQQTVQILCAYLLGKVRQGFRHHGRLHVPAIPQQQGVGGLVDQPHREQPGGLDFLRPAYVHAMGQGAARPGVGEHGVAVEGEQEPLDPVAVAGFARDVEFKHAGVLSPCAVLGSPSVDAPGTLPYKDGIEAGPPAPGGWVRSLTASTDGCKPSTPPC